jgi:kynurenine formamidase
MIPFPYKLIDLTHELSSATPIWDGGCGFEHRVHFDYDPNAEYKFRVHKIKMYEGIGTHMDSPAHCVPGGATIDKLQLSNLVAPCVVIDVAARSHERYSVSTQDIKNFEKDYGAIPQGSFAMMKTGWERHWNDPEKYRNNLLFPSVSADAAELLLERGIVGVGIDTLSPDREEDGFPVHKLILGAGKYVVENAANLSALSPQGNFIMVLPIKIKEGTEAPIRLIGLQ